jgi:competence ComEA-like helix-hairpin-helix protein
MYLSSSRFLIVVLCVLPILRLSASRWEKLEACKLVTVFYNDGDSFRVKHEGDEYNFRLYFVDTPERGLFYPDRIKEQADYFGISVNRCVRLGEKATTFSRRFLDGKFDVYTRWEKGGGTHVRYTAVIYANGESLIESLVKEGLARIHGFKPSSAWPGGMHAPSYLRKLKALEVKAQNEKLGGWKSSKTSLKKEAEWGANTSPPNVKSGQVDINTASLEELEGLPGIGPVFAQRIIDARPFESAEALIEINGIGAKTIYGIRDLVMVSGELNPKPAFSTAPEEVVPKTADFYLRDPFEWSGREIELSLSGLEVVDEDGPDGFAVFIAKTAFHGEDGGKIKVYLLSKLKDDALAYFEQTDRELILRVRFFNYNNEWIVVYRGNG